MSYEYSEEGLIEQATQDVLEELGWEVCTAWKIDLLINNIGFRSPVMNGISTNLVGFHNGIIL